jgi:CRISPR-associated protein Csm3
MTSAVAPVSHHRLLRRDSLRGTLVAESAVHVGAGGSTAAAAVADSPVARDGHDRPYVPGSSLRGALRSAVESLLLGIGGFRVCNLFAKEGEDASCAVAIQAAREVISDLTEERAFDIAWGASCEVCRLFGNSFLASRLRIADLPLLSTREEAPVYVRDGVGLDRDLKTAAKGILYSFEAVASGARFELRIELENAAEYELGLLLVGLDLFAQGVATVGGKGARGLGLAKVEELSVVRRTPRDFFEGGGGKTLDKAALAAARQAARAHYLREG